MDKIIQDNFERLLSQFVTMKSFSPEKTYLITMSLPKETKEAEFIVNKVEVIFKSMGIKNIKVIPWQIQSFEISK